jgi:hypothetical protein
MQAKWHTSTPVLRAHDDEGKNIMYMYSFGNMVLQLQLVAPLPGRDK